MWILVAISFCLAWVMLKLSPSSFPIRFTYYVLHFFTRNLYFFHFFGRFCPMNGIIMGWKYWIWAKIVHLNNGLSSVLAYSRQKYCNNRFNPLRVINVWCEDKPFFHLFWDLKQNKAFFYRFLSFLFVYLLVWYIFMMVPSNIC